MSAGKKNRRSGAAVQTITTEVAGGYGGFWIRCLASAIDSILVMMIIGFVGKRA